MRGYNDSGRQRENERHNNVMHRLRIGTRQSPLALWQADYVRRALLATHKQLRVELVKIVSAGDRTLDVPLSQVGGKGLFLKELETALLQGDIDLAVHSMKDVTVTLPDGLHIGAICRRDSPLDALVSNRYSSLRAMPAGARIGTCSLRRQGQLAALGRGFKLENLRGNVNSRLQRLDRGDFDAIVLAAAGLIRLDMRQRIAELIPPEISLPAVGQGAVGIECRVDQPAVNRLIQPLADADTACRVLAERTVNARLGGGCHVPIAAYAELEQDQLHLRAWVAMPDGSRVLNASRRGPRQSAEQLGIAVAEEMLRQGAAEILRTVYSRAER